MDWDILAKALCTDRAAPDNLGESHGVQIGQGHFVQETLGRDCLLQRTGLSSYN